MARISKLISLAVSVRAVESSLAIEVSAEEILVLLFACEIHYRSIFSTFDSFAC